MLAQLKINALTRSILFCDIFAVFIKFVNEWMKEKTHMKICHRSQNMINSDFKTLTIFQIILFNSSGLHEMQSFYLQFCVYAIQNASFYWDISSNFPRLLLILYSNSLFASHFSGAYLFSKTRETGSTVEATYYDHFGPDQKW